MQLDTGTLINIITIVLSGGVAWGIVKQQMKQFETRIEQLESDNRSNREILIEIKTKLNILLDGTFEKKPLK